VLGMRFVFDNSTNNVRNPNQPPAWVRFGMQSSDEMAEMWFQVLTRSSADFERLKAEHDRKTIQDIAAFSRRVLAQNPNDDHACTQLAKALLAQRETGRALAYLRRAVASQPNNDDAHYHLGVIALQGQNFAEAEQEFLTASRLSPENVKAWNNAGIACLRQNKLDEAAAYFQEALRLDPKDKLAQENLGIVQRAKAGR